MSDTGRNKKLNKEQIKNRVVKAATVAFCEKGIKNVRMDDIAADLSISKRTLYELFEDKEELLLEVMKAHNEEVKLFMADVIGKSENVLEVIFSFYVKATQEFQTINRLFFEETKKYPKAVSYQEKVRKENHSATLAFYQKGVDEGIFRDDVNFRIIQVMMQGQMEQIMQSEIGQYHSLVEIFETLVLMHLRGISTEKGLKMVNDFLLNWKQQNYK